MAGIELATAEKEYSYIGYLKVGDTFSMQVVLDTSTHKVILANSECKSCYTDNNLVAQKYNMTTAIKTGENAEEISDLP